MARRLAFIGTGYVGLVSGALFAEKGNQVVCVDIDEKKIAMLNEGRMPIYEPELEQIVHRAMKSGTLRFTTDTPGAVQDADATFVAVGTPFDPQRRRFDAAYLYGAIRQIGQAIRERQSPHYVVIKSTITPDIFLEANQLLRTQLQQHDAQHIQLISCPEFLREGQAVEDTRAPSRVVIGTTDPAAEEFMYEIHEPFCKLQKGKNILRMDPVSATLVKLGSNALRAMKVAAIDELAKLCDTYGGDVEKVSEGIGADDVIGPKFLHAGPGYGGSCFPKDLQALATLLNHYSLFQAVHDSNEMHKRYLPFKIKRYYGERIAGRTFALWGLAFKDRTDDVRDSSAIVAAQELLDAGARLQAYDPQAMENARKLLGERVAYCESKYDALEGADGLVIATNWDEFKSPEYTILRDRLRDRTIFDGRNILNIKLCERNGLKYFGIGRGMGA